MLILTRPVGTAVRIGDDIHIAILSYQGPQVRLGITAPRNVPVHREEVYERIRGRHGSVGTGINPHGPAPLPLAPDVADALQRSEEFIAGFEDDPMQEGVVELLAALRTLLRRGVTGSAN